MAQKNGWFDRLFGYKVEKSEEQNTKKETFSEPNFNDGALELRNAGGSFYGYGRNLDFEVPQDEVQLITKYRDVSLQPEFERAIDDVINQAFVYDEENFPVDIVLDDLEIPEKVKDLMREEFLKILYMMNFKSEAYEVFRRWYVDGRIYFHKVIDPNKPKDGIQEIRYIDPRKIRKIREEVPNAENGSTQQGISINRIFKEYYVFNPSGINNEQVAGLKIAKDSITYVHSGILSKDNKTVLSHIHKALRFFNALRQLEDSLVIYRLTRAAEKRVFNIEMGDLPKGKAEQYLQNLINKFRKKLTYNSESGEVLEQKRFMTMQEDFWFPKRDGRGTTVDILSGGQNLGELDDVDYFKRKLYESLNIPYSRLDPSSPFSMGRSSEITRDELKFQQFVNRLRKRFSGIFDDILKTQLLLKKIVTEKEWNDLISPNIRYDFLSDNFFTELKLSEIYQNRFNVMRDSLEAKQEGFVSKRWIRQNILQINDEEAEEIEKDLAEEKKSEADDMGFEIGQDVDNELPVPKPSPFTKPKQKQEDNDTNSENL